ncbi:MAG: zf-HC2 domain-containing protein [Planctomycetota bacterium]|nr:zf-HC2 domain-containing protein [Planctomycetota bacterium]MDA1139927.1 zf-HC2 domain-containing protein [Planctomycetota bacterium]
MKCKTVLKQLPRYVDRDLPHELETEIGLHLLDCEPCQTEMKAFKESRDALMGVGGQGLTAPALEALQKNVRSRMHREHMRNGAARALENNRTSWAFTLTTALAAATILCVAGVYLAYLQNYDVTQLSGTPVPVPAGTIPIGNAFSGVPAGMDVPVRHDLVETYYSIESARSVNDTMKKDEEDRDPKAIKEPERKRRPIRVKLVNF